MRADRDRPALRPGAEGRRGCGWGARAGCTLAGPPRPRPRERGAPTTERPRLAVPRVSELEGGGVSAGAGTEQIPKEGKEGREAKWKESEGKERRHSRRHGPSARWLPKPRVGAAPRRPGHTHCAPPPAPPRPAVRSGPERRAAAPAGSGRRGRAARGAGGSAHLAVRVPDRPAAASPRPRVLPGAGQPRARRMDGRRRRPAPALHGLPLRPVRRRAERAARGSGARGKLWLGVCDRRTGIRAPSVPPPSPTRGLPLSSGAAPVAPWRPPREGPTPNPPPATPEGPLANRSGTKPWVPGQQTSSGKEEDSLDRRVARVEGSVVRIGQDPLRERKKG
ncbi:translation initiation factor IF-2-like [Mirounga leonina]|uniref:translation initiation factor IF-2-like n=1 Tax=Mirounga leonina TaxID=9715 RepID=UPI00156C44B9|nr:translation initiation factor IF-2-like [Mirounga leonina]